MKTNRIKYLIIFFSYTVIYGLFLTIIRNDGYLNFEPLYVSHNFLMLKNPDIDLVKKFFFSYPILTHILAYPFSFINSLDAPFYASILFTSFLNTFIVRTIAKQTNVLFSIIVFIYLLTSPIFIYAATSGTSFYVYIIIYFYLFYMLFNYVKNYSIYYLTLCSIAISFIPFLDYKLLWIVLMLIPLLFIFTVKNFHDKDSGFILDLIRISKDKNSQKLFISNFISMVLIISFLPISVFLIYLMINNLYGDDFFFFLINNTSGWNNNNINNLTSTLGNLEYSLNAVNSFAVIKIILLISAFYCLEFVIDIKQSIKVVILAIIPVILILLMREQKIEMINLNFLVVFHIIAIASFLTFYKQNTLKSKNLKLTIYSLFFIGMIYGEFHYFKSSISIQEKNFFTSVTKNETNEILELNKRGAIFILNSIPLNSTILCDNSVFYPIITFDNNTHHFLENLSDDFTKALKKPAKHADYIIISKENSPLYSKDILAYYIKENAALLNHIIYESKYYQILKVRKS
ncbi:hypothetical protein FHR24_001114 [Wenyingzhuangia heitensis]|uniref:Dolichyl-phosphate-mannose-protein mannosyltransferase n=1 Tax=Wenyingzhuangia heitensis TaxID=1487859 RepID=A0ABX0U9P5_9FLAO|nr:hypothetical protein [Wenyingzhuangia heitensis]NIJ44675.1 hypothetical protein [Wenyingzhuangia heitensis]